MANDEVLVPTRAVNDIVGALSDAEIGAVFVQGDIGSGKTTILSELDKFIAQTGVDTTVVNVSYENASRGSLKPFADALGQEEEKSSGLSMEAIDLDGVLGMAKRRAKDNKVVIFTTKTDFNTPEAEVVYLSEDNDLGKVDPNRFEFEFTKLLNTLLKENSVALFNGIEYFYQINNESARKKITSMISSFKTKFGDNLIIPADLPALGERAEELEKYCIPVKPKKVSDITGGLVLVEDKREDIAYQVYKKIVDGKKGLVITTEAEKDVATRDIGDYRLLRDNKSDNEIEIGLKELNHRFSKQANAPIAQKEALMINGLYDLIRVNGFDAVYHVLMRLSQNAQKNGVSVVVPINPDILAPHELKLLERYATVVRKQTAEITLYSADVKQEQLEKRYIELAKVKKLIVKVDDLDKIGENGRKLLENLVEEGITVIGASEKGFLMEKMKNQIESSNRKVYETSAGFDEKEIGLLIASELTGDVDESFVKRMYERYGGKPGYIKEALKVLKQKGKLTNDAILGWNATDIAVPTDLDQIVSDRIRGANLTSEQMKALQYAATFGNSDINNIYSAMGVSRETDEGRRLDMQEKILEAIDVLESNGLVKKSGKKVIVNSEVVRAVYETISPEKRKVIHAKIANTLDKDFVTDPIVQEKLLEHYAKSEQTPEVLGKMITYASALSDTPDVSSEKYIDAAIGAIESKERMGIVTNDDVKLKFNLIQKEQSIIAMRSLDEAIAYNEKAVNEAATQFQRGRADRSTVARLRLNTGNLRLNKADYKGAAEEFSRAQAILEVAGDKLGLAKCYAGLGIAYMQLGNELESDANINRALDFARKCTEDESKEIETMLYYHSCENALKKGKIEDAIGEGMTALQIAKTIPNGVGAVHKINANFALADVYEKMGDAESMDSMISHLNGAITIAHEHSYLKPEAQGKEKLGMKYLELGKQQPNLVSDGITELEGALKVYGKIRDEESKTKIVEISNILGSYRKINSEKSISNT